MILIFICYFIFSSSSINLSFNIFICVPFMPRNLNSITPALSNLRNAFTITERVIPTLSAILDATNSPSVPLSSLKYRHYKVVLHLKDCIYC